MNRVQKIVLAALTALALAAGAANAAPQLAGDPSQWGVARKGSFDITESNASGVAKVNEYEGQHRLTAS